MAKKRKETQNWYDQHIEPEIKSVVKALRENGINTVCSCGHDMYIECEYYPHQEMVTGIHNLLVEMEREDFTITVRWEYHKKLMWLGRVLIITFPRKDGTYYEGKSIKK